MVNTPRYVNDVKGAFNLSRNGGKVSDNAILKMIKGHHQEFFLERKGVLRSIDKQIRDEKGTANQERLETLCQEKNLVFKDMEEKYQHYFWPIYTEAIERGRVVIAQYCFDHLSNGRSVGSDTLLALFQQNVVRNKDSFISGEITEINEMMYFIHSHVSRLGIEILKDINDEVDKIKDAERKEAYQERFGNYKVYAEAKPKVLKDLHNIEKKFKTITKNSRTSKSTINELVWGIHLLLEKNEKTSQMADTLKELYSQSYHAVAYLECDLDTMYFDEIKSQLQEMNEGLKFLRHGKKQFNTYQKNLKAKKTLEIERDTLQWDLKYSVYSKKFLNAEKKRIQLAECEKQLEKYKALLTPPQPPKKK